MWKTKYPEQVKRLKKYRIAKAEYLVAQRNLEELETLLTKSTTPLTGMKVQTMPITDKLSGKMDAFIAIEKQCNQKRDNALNAMRETLRLIELVKTPICKQILTMRWEQIAENLTYDYSNVSRLHNKAIEELMENEKS